MSPKEPVSGFTITRIANRNYGISNSKERSVFIHMYVDCTCSVALVAHYCGNLDICS